VTERPFHEIWTGSAYRRLRLQMLTGDLPGGSVCSVCENTRREPDES